MRNSVIHIGHIGHGCKETPISHIVRSERTSRLPACNYLKRLFFRQHLKAASDVMCKPWRLSEYSFYRFLSCFEYPLNFLILITETNTKSNSSCPLIKQKTVRIKSSLQTKSTKTKTKIYHAYNYGCLVV